MIESIWGGRECSTVDSYCNVIRKYLAYARERSLSTSLPLSSLAVAEYFMHLKKSEDEKMDNYFVPRRAKVATLLCAGVKFVEQSTK